MTDAYDAIKNLSDVEFATWLEQEPSEHDSLINVVQEMTPQERNDLVVRGKSVASAAMSSLLRGVGHLTFPNGWDLSFLRVCHAQKVNSWAVDTFYVTHQDLRLLQLHSGQLVSFYEFQHVFGRTLEEHLAEHVDAVRDHAALVIEQAKAALVDRSITLSTPSGVHSVTIRCLEVSSIENWAEVPPDAEVLDTGNIVTPSHATRG